MELNLLRSAVGLRLAAESERSDVRLVSGMNSGNESLFSTTHFSTVEDSGFNEKRSKESQVSTARDALLESSSNGEEIESRHRRNGRESSPPLPSNDETRKSPSSSCSTYFSYDEENYDIRFEPPIKNAPAKESSSVQLPATGASTIPSGETGLLLFYIRQLFDVLEDKEYTTELRCHENILNEAVDALVHLADSTCKLDVAWLCISETIKSVDKVYGQFLTSSNSPDEETLWIHRFSVFLKLCDSEVLREELVEFFISRLLTPKSTEDLDDVKQIIGGLTEQDKAHFGLMRLNYVLKKYAKSVEDSANKTNICSAKSELMNSDFRRRIEFGKKVRQAEWLKEMDKYSANNCYNFPMLVYILARNIILLKTRSSQTPL